MKTTIEQSIDQCVVKNKLQYPETINEREYKAISDGLIDGLVPVQIEKSKSEVTVKTALKGVVSLETYLNSVVSKSMFLNVVTQLIRIIKECENNLLNIGNLLLDYRYIFLDPETKKINCIFWPIINNQHSFLWSEFFQDLPFHTVFSKDEKHDYVSQYLNYFKHSIPLSINRFEGLIAAIKDNTPDSTVLGDYLQTLTKENKQTEDHAASQVKYLDISEVLGISGNQGTGETAVLEADSGTTVLGDHVFEEPAFPYLVREKTQETIYVDRQSFRIGKEKHCDYVVLNNNAVSRSHADIITRDHRYYIIDNHSTNKTYVESRPIPANKEVEIFSGTKIRLANEDFIFYL
jgi:hypothetical protein